PPLHDQRRMDEVRRSHKPSSKSDRDGELGRCSAFVRGKWETRLFRPRLDGGAQARGSCGRRDCIAGRVLLSQRTKVSEEVWAVVYDAREVRTVGGRAARAKAPQSKTQADDAAIPGRSLPSAIRGSFQFLEGWGQQRSRGHRPLDDADCK